MKSALLDIEAVLSNANAELSKPHPDVEKAVRAIGIAQSKLLEMVEQQEAKDPLHDAKHKLVVVYMGMPDHQMSEADVELFTLLAKDRKLQDEIERARKNN